MKTIHDAFKPVKQAKIPKEPKFLIKDSELPSCTACGDIGLVLLLDEKYVATSRPCYCSKGITLAEGWNRQNWAGRGPRRGDRDADEKRRQLRALNARMGSSG